MKLTSVLLAALLTTSTTLAADVAIDCKAQAMPGNSATITGTLQVTEQAKEYAAVEGTLHVFIGGSTMQPVMDADVKVSGARLDDGSISLAAIEDQSIAMIYVNSNGKDLSGIEKDGTRYSSNCTK